MIAKGVSTKKQIRILSKNDMDREMKRIQDLFKKKESEETWAQFDQALKNIKLWATADKIYQYPGFVDHIKLLQRPIISSLTSERTRLSGTASDLLQALAQTMERKYEIIHELFMPTLIRLFSRSNKVHVRNTLTCFKNVVQHSKVPRTTHRLCSILKSNSGDANNKITSNSISKSTRYHVTECLNTVIQVNATNDLLRYVEDIEAAIKNTAMDSAPEVRSSIRMCYKLYCEKIPDRASKFSETLSPEISRYLQLNTGHRASSTTAGLKTALGKRPAASARALAEPSSKRRHIPSPTASTSLKTRHTAVSSTTTSDTQRKPTPIPSTATSIRNTATASSMNTKHRPSPSALSSSSSIPRPKASTVSYLSATTSSTAKKTTPSSTPLSKSNPSTPNLRTKYLGQNDSNLQLPPDFRLESRVYIRGKPPMRQRKEPPPSNDESNNDKIGTEDGNSVTCLRPLLSTSGGTSTVRKMKSTMDGSS